MSNKQTCLAREIQEKLKALRTEQIQAFVEGGFPSPGEFERLHAQEPEPILPKVGGPSPQSITHNGDVYVRRDVVERIIRSSFGPKEALTKIRSL